MIRRAATTAFLLALLAAPLAAQRARKDPGVATLVAVAVPGGGQMYAGEVGKGLGLFFGSAAAVGVGAGFSAREKCLTLVTPDPFGGRFTTRECEGGDWRPLYVGAGLAAVVWLYGVVDAAPAARRFNRRHGLARFGEFRPLIAGGPPGSVRAGFAWRPRA